MSAWSKAIQKWNDYWFQEVPPYSLAAFRILFGIYLLWYFLRFASNVELMFSDQGVYAPFLITDLGLPILWAWVIYLVTVLVILAFIAGFKTRLVTPLLLALYLYYFFLNFSTIDTAFDRLNIMMLAILCFAKVDGAWALSRACLKQTNGGCLVSVWPIRMLTLQIAILYFGAGLWKLIGPQWHTGEMMKWTMAGPWGSDLSFQLLKSGWPSWCFNALVGSIIAFELTMPFALFNRKTRPIWIVLGLLFHILIACLLNIPEFMNCVCAYVLFMKPDEIQRRAVPLHS